MKDLNYALKQLCQRNRDGNFATLRLLICDGEKPPRSAQCDAAPAGVKEDGDCAVVLAEPDQLTGLAERYDQIPDSERRKPYSEGRRGHSEGTPWVAHLEVFLP